MGLDNDTRGWVMTCVSGVGKLSEQCELGLASKLDHSLRIWF